MNNPFSFLRNKLIQKPATIDGNLVNKVITSPTQFTEKERQLLRQIGASVSTISNIFSDVLSINLERAGIYREVERSCDHPYMTGALELYADCATTYNYLHNATVWVTSDNQKYSNDLNEMLNNICIEEKIFDWAWTIAAFGDLFPRVIAKPGLGIITVDDDEHPLNISRVDYNGILVGFIQTPQGQPSSSSNSITLMPPWEYCLRGDTKIKLLNNTYPTIKEMADNPAKYIGKYVLSVNPDILNLEPDKIVEVKKTKLDAVLVRVHLDNGKHIDCTEDHRFMMRDGSYKEAKDLQHDDSLMPVYTRLSNTRMLKGYEIIYNPGKNRWNMTHRLVYNYMYGKPKKGNIIHHKWDNEKRAFEKLNNEPSNLDGSMSNNEHIAFHGSIHYDGCMCVSCRAHRGDRPKHKTETCACYICKVNRGENSGENHFNYIERETRLCACGCGDYLITKVKGRGSNHKFIRGHYWKFTHGTPNIVHDTKTCACTRCKAMRHDADSKLGFRALVTKECKRCGKLFENATVSAFANHGKTCKRKHAVLNHKVVAVEYLDIREDVYDLMTERNHNFPLEAGVFVHNCHFRLLGAKRKRTVYDDPSFLEYRTLQPIGGEKRQVTSKYGTSILLNAIPTYKRLRLAEDSLLLARTTRGIMKYIYKIKVDSTNLEGVAEIVDNYTSLLKHARAIDNSSGSPHFDNKANPMASVEDIIIPVWGDSANDLVIDKIGGEVDIKWIKDIEELRNELSAALRVPLSLLGAHVEETSGALGGSSLEKLDIRFARSSRRLQRALIEGITRLCQIHLAYQNLDPDTRLFQVHMGETSTAEEESLQESLGKGVDTISTLFDVIEKASPNFDKVKLLDYFNKKFLKLNDLDFSKYIKNMPVEQEHTVPAEGEDQDVGNDLDLGAELGAGEKLIDKLPNEAKEAIIEAIQEKKEMHEVLRNSDFRAATPSPDGMVLWESRYKTCKVKVEKRN